MAYGQNALSWDPLNLNRFVAYYYLSMMYIKNQQETHNQNVK